MSKPSGRRSTYKKKKVPEAVGPETQELRDQVRVILSEIRAFAQSVEVLTRQKYTPAILMAILEHYLNLFPAIATLAHSVSTQVVLLEDQERQACVTNAAAVMLFFQGPILAGVFSEKSPGDVLREFIDVVNAQAAKEVETDGEQKTEDPEAQDPKPSDAN